MIQGQQTKITCQKKKKVNGASLKLRHVAKFNLKWRPRCKSLFIPIDEWQIRKGRRRRRWPTGKQGPILTMWADVLTPPYLQQHHSSILWWRSPLIKTPKIFVAQARISPIFTWRYIFHFLPIVSIDVTPHFCFKPSKRRRWQTEAGVSIIQKVMQFTLLPDMLTTPMHLKTLQ